jgi:hypothetical protein
VPARAEHENRVRLKPGDVGEEVRACLDKAQMK